MSQLVAMFCDIDDFCKHFEPIYTQRLLQSGQRQRTRPPQLSLSEMMTIIVSFHQSGYRDFKRYYTQYVAVHWRPYFPNLVSYNRFVELMPRTLVPLCNYLHTRKGRCSGITFVDSTPLAVCHNKRIGRHQVFEAWATRGKCSMGWYFGFKLHLMVNDERVSCWASGSPAATWMIVSRWSSWPTACGVISTGIGATFPRCCTIPCWRVG